MKLTLNMDSLKNEREWDAAGIRLPRFDIPRAKARTLKVPRWVHFGAGNIFRGYIAELSQRLLESGRTDTGVIAAETYDGEIIGRIFKPHDNLTLRVVLNADGTTERSVVASVAQAVYAGEDSGFLMLCEIFKNPGLQMVSFTVTEKAYNPHPEDSLPSPETPTGGEKAPVQLINQIAALLYVRYVNGAHPIALVSMDNCSKNGDRLRDAVLKAAQEHVGRELPDKGFLDYVNDKERVAFPLSMIDKITPHPSERVSYELRRLGFESEIIQTAKHTFAAPFVNLEKAEYLVIEDRFSNGRPPLEEAGVLFAGRESVERAERMKVSACLNPLHTALAVYGCLLGYKSIADEMRDPCLNKLVRIIGYKEGLPVVLHPGVIEPEAFLDEVVNERLINSNLPDTPQRIASDTSQKLSVRYGETIKACISRGVDMQTLKGIPLAIAGWARYLLGVDDSGEAMPLSPDPLLPSLEGRFSGTLLGNVKPDLIRPILSDRAIFGLDLYEAGLGVKIETYFALLCAGRGAVRRTLESVLESDV